MSIFRILRDTFLSGPPGDIDDEAYQRYHRDSLIPSIDTIASFRLKNWWLQGLVYIVEKGTVYSYQPASVEADDGDSYIHDLNGRVYKKEGFDGAAVPGTPGKTGGAFSFEFDGASQTMEDVADGTFRLNDATPEDATALAISAALADATDVSALFAARLDSAASVKGRLIVTTGANRLEFEVTSITDNGDWLQLALQNGAIIGALADEDACELVVEAVDRIVGVSSFNGETGDVTVELREVLTAHRTYYVDGGSGSDSNDGLSSGAGAFATLTKAFQVVYALDLSIYNVTISVASGTYAEHLIINGLHVGSGSIILQGDTGTPSNVQVNRITAQYGARVTIKGMEIIAQTLSASNGAVVTLETSMAFNWAGVAMTATDAIIVMNYCAIEIGSSCTSILLSNSRGYFSCFSTAFTLTGTPTWGGGGAVYLSSKAHAWLQSSTFTGAATGKRYTVGIQSLIQTAGAGTSHIPGDVAGTVLSAQFAVYN